MSVIISIAVVVAIVGSGLVTGLLFAFSNFVMRALAQLPPREGMFAMQRINVSIINPLFLILFIGTPVLCVLIAIHSALLASGPERWWLFTGALAYLLGPFAITVRCNVPLNNQLAAADPLDAARIWPEYQRDWQYWNHIRTAIGVASVAFLTIGSGVSAT